MSKIRRNDPCPCGSGKKYKKCCMNSGKQVVQENRTLRYMQTHDSGEILNIIVALQLNPNNRGANVRMERLARYAALTMHEGGLPVNKQEFIRILNEEFASDPYEDFPTNLHADTLTAMAGTHIIFPGIATNATELLQTITNVLYMGHGSWPIVFEDTVLPAMKLMLELGDMMAACVHINGVTKGEDRRGDLFDYSGLDKEYWISQDVMGQMLARYQIAQEFLDAFVIDVDKVRSALSDEYPDNNPLFERPIIRYKDRYYFLLISNQADSLRRYILNMADICGCLAELIERCHELEWGQVQQALQAMEWGLTDIAVANPLQNTKECICKFDENWLAYVIFSYDTAEDVRNGRTMLRDVSQRIKDVQHAIAWKTQGENVLLIILSATMGEMGYSLGPGAIDEPYVAMNVNPFVQLAKIAQWKQLDLLYFAESYREIRDMQKQYLPLVSMVDMYAVYRQNNCSFYLSDNPRPSIILPENIDGGYEMIVDRKIAENRHALPYIMNGVPASVAVEKDPNFFPMYTTVYPSLPFLACVENGRFPIWVSCRQETPQARIIADTYGKSILFWIYRINEVTKGKGIEPNMPMEISLEFDEKALNPIIMNDDTRPDEPPYEFTLTKHGIHMLIHQNGLLMMQKVDNSGERQMMIELIDALSEGKAGHQLVDTYMPQNNGKMILLYQADATSAANNVNLLRPRMIHEYVRQHIMDMLPKWMEEKGYGFEGRITEKEEKEQALRYMVDTLLDQLAEYVKQFEYKSLLKFAVWNYESLVWERDHKKVLNPAKAYCFGVNEKMREENNLYEQRLTQAGLSLRCVVEYLAAQPYAGGEKQVGAYELVYMMGLMEAVVSYGEFCDAIHMGVSDQEVEKLPSGRYGIYHDDFEAQMEAFRIAYGEDMLAGEMRIFGERFKQKETKPEIASMYPPIEELDVAFETDWGVRYQDIILVSKSMSQMCVDNNESVMQLPEKTTVEEVSRSSGLSQETVKKTIERLSIQPRERYLQAPDGFSNTDVHPWNYNRELSFLRRFIVREVDENGVYLTFGLRNATATSRQLNYLLFHGQLNGGAEIEKLKGRFSTIKGKIFNDFVRTYLMNHTEYEIRYDVPIKNDYPFQADRDYGDVDVLAFDQRACVVYSIECKDAEMAKNIRQMKAEIDKFLGRDEKDKKKAWVVKHVGRHVWLNNHKEELAKYLNVDEIKEVKSMMLTSSVLPVSYLRESPLPILSFLELEKANGDLAKLLP